ncbi:MAG: alpha/beta hydrolase [Saprospiraceae bacterium]|nr:alpha/beta hydrolase [Saprospiraceae bacterium]
MKGLFVILFFLCLISCEDIDSSGNLVPLTAYQDALLPSIEVNGTVLHAETFGDISKPIIIFLHGGPGGDYRALISEFGAENSARYPSERTVEDSGLTRLQDDYFLVFYDQRGAGLSQRQWDVSFQEYMDDLDGVVDYYLTRKFELTGLSDEKVNIFGWSFGGILATSYINSHPEKVENLILYEPGPFSKDVWDYLKANTTSIFAQVGKDWLEEYLLSKDHITPDSYERADYQLMVNVFRAQPEFHEHPDTPLWRFGAMLSDDNLDFSLSQDYDISSNIKSSFEGNTLFMAGSLTTTELPDYMDMQRGYYPSSEYYEIPETGHTGPWEKPEEVSEQIRNFIK